MDDTPTMAFVAVTPCRLVDTRGFGFSGEYGPPSLVAGGTRPFDLNSGPCPGLPEPIGAYSLNVTVVNPAAAGHLALYPSGSFSPSVSSINFVAGQTIANAVIVPAGIAGHVSVDSAAATDIVIDVNGYFSLTPAPLVLTNNSIDVPTARFVNQSGNCRQGCAIWAASRSATDGQAIYAELPLGGYNSAAIKGRLGASAATGLHPATGVRGEGEDSGVLGISFSRGVTGSVVGPGGEAAWGVIGSRTELWKEGVELWGVFSGGDIGATGTKSFLDPHPTDPSRAIRYVSLEGPEAGTYFRGRTRFQNGIARIAVPEHFRLVTDPEGLTVQITPIGAMATFAVLQMDLGEIVVQGSRNVEFSYLVQGVRATYKDVDPLRESAAFVPRSAGEKLPKWLTPAQQRLLVQNGTYREDGTVNLETARKLGWDRVWLERERPGPEPRSE